MGIEETGIEEMGIEEMEMVGLVLELVLGVGFVEIGRASCRERVYGLV